jgi:effector-binding domain-containing protein
MVETVKYSVLKKIGDVEIRKYPSLILASTTKGSDDNSSFMIIANYIFGNNKSSKKISMTAPVITSEKISMTTPVITSNYSNKMKMSFVMPSEYTLKTLPKPNSSDVKIETIKSAKLAVLRFTGFTPAGKVNKLQDRLIKTLNENKIKIKSAPFLMRYNSPWTIPFIRRNEVAVEVN